MTAKFGGPQDGSDEIDFGKLLQTLWHSRYLIAATSALALVAAGFNLANTPPTYQADALLQLEEKAGGGGLALPSGLSDLLPQNSRTVTEIEILGSRLILGQVVAQLNLDWQVSPVRAPLIGNALLRYDLPLPDIGGLRAYGRRGDRIALDLLEVPPDWVGARIVLTVQPDNSYSLDLPDGSQMTGQPGAVLRNPANGFALQVSQLAAAPGRQFNLSQISERSAIERVKASFSVAERAKQSSILELRYLDQNREEATRILDAIAAAYVRQNIDRSAAVAESSLAFINQQLPQAQARVATAENALNAYRQKQQSVDLTFETENVLSQISRIEGELRDLQLKEDDIKQRYKTSHPIYQQLLTQRARLEQDLQQYRAQVEALPETQKEVLNLTRNLELAQQIYTELLTRAQEVQVLKASTVGNVRVIDGAVSNPVAVAPHKSRTLGLALLLGIAAGMGISLARSWLRRSIQGAEPLEALGLSVFATINLAAGGKRVPSQDDDHGVVALSQPTDLAIEGLRSLRTSLQFGMLDARTRSLAITSSGPHAGKSFTATNLAVVTAQAGHSVCLIDADLRRGQLRKAFGGHKNEIGLSEYLAGEASLADVLRPGPVDGMWYIPTGRYPPNPSELLMRHRLDELIAELDSRFDLTLLDCPPVLAVTDPVIVGRKTGGVLAVVRYDVTPLAEVQAMVKAFETAGVRLTGAILNGFDPRRAKAGHYSYNYNYRYEYKNRQD